jgi:hypothetical protein
VRPGGAEQGGQAEPGAHGVHGGDVAVRQRPGDGDRVAGGDQLLCALLRYNSARATIQVREIPEDLYEVLRRRARRSGQSLQAYMRDQVVALARQPTK